MSSQNMKNGLQKDRNGLETKLAAQCFHAVPDKKQNHIAEQPLEIKIKPIRYKSVIW